MSPADEHRFFAKMELTSSGCWEWKASRNPQGYGRIVMQGRLRGAHQVAYETFREPAPERGSGRELDHLCRNRACVNPAHLEVVSHRVNVLRGDGIPAVHAAKTHCPRGHEYDDANTRRSGGRRYCRRCSTITKRASRARRAQAA